MRLEILIGLFVVGCAGRSADGGDSEHLDEDAGVSMQSADAGADAVQTGVPVLGTGTHDPEELRVRALATNENGLQSPRDVDVHPDDSSQLWVTNSANNSVLIVFYEDDEEPTFSLRAGFGNDHFMPSPSALAFGQTGRLATAHETDEITQSETPEDFMGPTLWTSDPSEFDGGHASHYDMLHNSPNATGIAWVEDNIYWVFDGFHESLTRYDFGDDHGPAGEDHSDGLIERFKEGAVGYVEGVSSHMAWDAERSVLYFADPGRSRVASFDPAAAETESSLWPNYDGCTMRKMRGGEIATLVDEDDGLERPSGLAHVTIEERELLLVGDNATSTVYAISLEGEILDFVSLEEWIPAGGLQSVTLHPNGCLLAVDSESEQLLEICANR